MSLRKKYMCIPRQHSADPNQAWRELLLMETKNTSVADGSYRSYGQTPEYVAKAAVVLVLLVVCK